MRDYQQLRFSPAGWVPSNWTVAKLSSIAEVSYGISDPLEKQRKAGVRIIGMPNVTKDGDFNWDTELYVDPDKLTAKVTVRIGDILFNWRNGSIDHLGKSARYTSNEIATHVGFLLKIRAKSTIDSGYLEAYLKHIKIRGYFLAAKQQVNNTFNKEELSSVPIVLPPLSEQRRIAQIIGIWDKAIEKTEALRAAKKRRRKGILQQLIGKGVDFPTDWKTKPLSAVTTRVSRTNDGGDHPVMTISAKSGFLMQSDKFARDMAGSSVDKYTLLHQGEFAYNKGNSKTAPYGCIFALDRPTAVIPFVYFCFQLNEGQHHAFFAHIFAAGILNHQLSRVINSGVRNDGLLNLYADDFFACRVPVPPYAEQEKIARAITALNDEVALLDSEIEALQRQKRGLMQKLLTGEWRVTPDSPHFHEDEKEAAHG